MSGAHVGDALARLCALLAEVADVLEERVHGPAPPAWAERRGWSEALLALDDATLERAEQGDVARVIASTPTLPPSLRALAAAVIERTAVPLAVGRVEPRPLRRASERKRAQVAALTALARRLAPRARRIVDVGAGHGHLTRELARALALPALGIEVRPHVVEGARALTTAGHVSFVAADALSGTLDAREDDLLVGLHACGALGDALIRSAAESGAGVLLIACCPQKIPDDARAPLSARGRALGLIVPRPQLGLANLATLAQGGKDSAGAADLRRARYALALLLRDAGVALPPGDEVHGIPRRQLRRPLAEVAARAFALRGLAPPSPLAVEDAARRAGAEHARVRRLALPRAMLARPLELALALDRAALLEERGAAPEVVEAFDRSASPRNLAILRRVGAPRS